MQQELVEAFRSLNNQNTLGLLNTILGKRFGEDITKTDAKLLYNTFIIMKKQSRNLQDLEHLKLLETEF